MMIIGSDYHPRFEKIAMLEQETKKLTVRRLEHEDGEAKRFYASLPKGTLVGIEATHGTQWFERLLAECGHELWIGDPAEIRARRVRRQKTDRRDAEHLLELLLTSRFPRVWVPTPEERARDIFRVGRHPSGIDNAGRNGEDPELELIGLTTEITAPTPESILSP